MSSNTPVYAPQPLPQGPTPVPLPSKQDARLLVHFLDPGVGTGIKVNNKPRQQLSQIRSLSFDELLKTPEYVQHMFPITGWGPVDREFLLHVRTRNEILQDMRGSVQSFMSLLGFIVEFSEENEILIGFAGESRDRYSRWLKDADQCHLWISRMFASLRLFGLHDDAIKLYFAFLVTNTHFGNTLAQKILDHWEKIVSSSLALLSSNVLDFLPSFYDKQFYKVQLEGGSDATTAGTNTNTDATNTGATNTA
ncbi:hypothetical protein F5B19DRAFT_440928 [Rostrohypoxylon terebratum]|nr:hypothetical protein F5B19DRAFT_440928 [Rostrohypoxylon terebratum]